MAPPNAAGSWSARPRSSSHWTRSSGAASSAWTPAWSRAPTARSPASSTPSARPCCTSSRTAGPHRPPPGELGAGGTAMLYLLQNGRPTATYPLDKPVVVIGRMSDSDVVVNDPGASRHHAEIRIDGNRYVLRALG